MLTCSLSLEDNITPNAFSKVSSKSEDIVNSNTLQVKRKNKDKTKTKIKVKKLSKL
jgi:hypothetical protein